MYPNQGLQSLENQGPWPQAMAGTKTPTQIYSTGRVPELNNPPPPFSPNIYPPGNVFPTYPHSVSTRAPQFRQNVPNPTAVGPQYPMNTVSSYQYPPVSKCFQGKPYCQELSQSSAQYSGLTYPVQHPYSIMRNQLSSVGMSSRMPCHPSVQSTGVTKGETAWAQCNQTYTPQLHNNVHTTHLPKRSAEDLSAPENPPSKRICSDQGGQPYSVQVNGYQKGLHIQGSCYLTVRQDGNQQKTPTVSNAVGSGSMKSIHSPPVQNKSASYGVMQDYVQDHLDVSVTPVLPNSQNQNDSPLLPVKELNQQTAMRAILALVNIACKCAPIAKQWFANFRYQHNALCLPDKMCAYILPLIKLPKDKQLMEFYVKHRSRLCKLANGGRCPSCDPGFKMPEQKGTSGHIDNWKVKSGLNFPKSTGISQGHKFPPLVAMQAAVASAGQNVLCKSTKSNGNFCRTPFPETHRMAASIGTVPPRGLNDGANPGSPSIASTFLSESEFKDTPYSARKKSIDNERKNDSVNSQVTYPPTSPHLPQGMDPYSTPGSVLNKQITNPYAMTANMKPVQHMWQPGIVNNFASCSPSVTQNQQGFPTYNSVANNLSVTNCQSLTPTAKLMNPVLPRQAVDSDVQTQQFQLHNMQTRDNYPALSSVLNKQIGNISPSVNAGDVFSSRYPHLVYTSNQPQHKQHMGNLQVPTTGCSNPSTRNAPSATCPSSSSTYSANMPDRTVLPQQYPSLERSDKLSEPNRTSTILQTFSPTFRQQAASLMKLPESINTDKKPCVSSTLPSSDIMNCFSLKPHTENEVSPQSTKSRRLSNESSGMILPHRIKSECIVIEDSDDEDHPTAKTCEAAVVNAFSDTRADTRETTNTMPCDSSQAEEVRSLSSNTLTNDSSDSVGENKGSTTCNSSECIPNENSAASPHKLHSGEQSQNPVPPPNIVASGSSKDNGGEKCAKETSSEKMGSVPLSEAMQLIEEDKSLDSLVACGEATFATFIFDEGTGDLEITTAEFGEEEWEQLMQG